MAATETRSDYLTALTRLMIVEDPASLAAPSALVRDDGVSVVPIGALGP